MLSLSNEDEAALAAIDLRAGGRWSLTRRIKNACIRGGVRAGLRLADILPPEVLLRSMAAGGAVAHRLLAHERRVAQRNVELALGLPPADAGALVAACFRHAGENLARCLLLRRSGQRALDYVVVPAESRRTLDDALALGRGVVFVSAHLGPFEHVAAAVAELGARPAVVVRESYDPGLDPLVDAHRRARGVEVIHRGSAHAPLRIVRALRQGRPVGFLPDLGGRVPRVPTSFLGRPASLPVGPQRIALRARAPVVVGTLHPEGPRAVLRIQELPSAARTRAPPDEALLTRAVSEALEQAIRASPSHWLWMGLSLP